MCDDVLWIFKQAANYYEQMLVSIVLKAVQKYCSFPSFHPLKNVSLIHGRDDLTDWPTAVTIAQQMLRAACIRSFHYRTQNPEVARISRNSPENLN